MIVWALGASPPNSVQRIQAETGYAAFALEERPLTTCDTGLFIEETVRSSPSTGSSSIPKAPRRVAAICGKVALNKKVGDRPAKLGFGSELT